MAQKISVLGIDIAKPMFHVVGMDDAGHVVLRKRLARSELPRFIANLALQGLPEESEKLCQASHYVSDSSGRPLVLLC